MYIHTYIYIYIYPLDQHQHATHQLAVVRGQHRRLCGKAELCVCLWAFCFVTRSCRISPELHHKFTGTSPHNSPLFYQKFTRNSSKCHHNFARKSNWSTSKKGIINYNSACPQAPGGPRRASRWGGAGAGEPPRAGSLFACSF